jgi:hypothetical protein
MLVQGSIKQVPDHYRYVGTGFNQTANAEQAFFQAAQQYTNS